MFPVNDSDLCLACRKERGMVSLVGFGERCSFSRESTMAIMIPGGIDQFGMDGEGQLSGFLKTAAKPGNLYENPPLPPFTKGG
jgi:hypothetical protein